MDAVQPATERRAGQDGVEGGRKVWGRRIVALLLLAAAILPFIHQGRFIARSAMDIPSMDDYDTVLGFLLYWKYSSGPGERWYFFNLQHNEHRPITLRLGLLLLMEMGGVVNFFWLIVAGNAFWWGVAAILMVWALGRVGLPWVLAPMIPFFLLVPLQLENTLWATAALTNYGVVLLAVVYAYAFERHPAASLAAFVSAVYTSAAGLMLLPATALYCLLHRRRWSSLAILGAEALIAALYSVHYGRPGQHIYHALDPNHWGTIAQYFLRLAGGAAGGGQAAAWVGCMVMPALALALMRFGKEAFVGITLVFLAGNMGLIALIRGGMFEPAAPIPNRYFVYPILLTSMVMVCLFRALPRSRAVGLLMAGVGLLAAVNYGALHYSLAAEYRVEHLRVFLANGLLEYLKGGNGALAYPDKDKAFFILQQSEREGIYRITDQTRFQWPIRVPGPAEIEPRTIRCYFEQADAGTVRGWGVVLNRPSSGLEILVLLQGSGGVVALECRRRERPDVAKVLKHHWYLHSGFNASLPLYRLRPGLYKVGLWLRDAERDYRIISSRTITVE